MKKTYEIQGMTCNGYRNNVEKTILSVAGVSDVSVDLEKAEATVESQFEVPLENFKKALDDKGGRYTIEPTTKVK